MKATFRRDIKDAYLVIEEDQFYEEDYQMPMLQNNHIPGLLQIEGYGIDEKSQYTYQISGMESMKSYFEKRKMEREDMEQIILQIVKLTKVLKNYLLNPDKLMLDPSYIFMERKQWCFCYFPLLDSSKTLCHSFHEVTEYFVSQVDYEKKEGIHLAYELHKATMQENYDIEKIMEEFELMEQEQEFAIDRLTERGNIFSLDDEPEEDDEPVFYEDVQMIREERGVWGNLKKVLHRKKQSKWGDWEDEKLQIL